MKSPKQLIKFLSKRVLNREEVNQEGRNYYRRHATELKKDLRSCPKFFLGKLEDWDIDREELGLPNQVDIRLPYPSMLIEFTVTGDITYNAGVLFRQTCDAVIGECYIGHNKAMFIYTFEADVNDDNNNFIFRLPKSKKPDYSQVLDDLSIDQSRKELGKAERYTAAVELELLGIELTRAAIWATLFMNEGALTEETGDSQTIKMDASRIEGDVVYKTLLLDPTKAKRIMASRGGTHASPRFHTRRGHWRHLETGKKVWIGPMEVGDKADGEVIKDYKVKSTGLWDQLIDKINQYTAFAKGER